MTGVCSSRNTDLVRSLGAARVVDYTSEDWVDGTRYDVIIDNVGNRSAAECRRSLTASGRCVMVGGPKSNPWIDPFGHLLAGKVGFAFRSQEFRWFTATDRSDDLASVWAFVERGELRPVIDRRIGLDHVPAAMSDLATGHTRGKIVVVP